MVEYNIPEAMDKYYLLEAMNEYYLPKNMDEYYLPEAMNEYYLPEAMNEYYLPKGMNEYYLPKNMVEYYLPEAMDELRLCIEDVQGECLIRGVRPGPSINQFILSSPSSLVLSYLSRRSPANINYISLKPQH